MIATDFQLEEEMYGLVEDAVSLPEYDNILDLFYYADLVISNDSMAAHLAAILEKPCLAIHSQLSNYALYKYYPTVKSVMPDAGECKECHFKGQKGYSIGIQNLSHPKGGRLPM